MEPNPPQPPTPPTPPKAPTPKPEGDDSISMLRKQLYQNTESSELKTRNIEMATPKPLPKAKPHIEPTPGLTDVMSKQKARRKRILRISLSIVGILAIIGGAAAATTWYRNSRQVKTEQLVLGIEVPPDVTAGSEVDITYTYKNGSKVVWNNVELMIEVPQGLKVSKTSDGLNGTAKHTYTYQVGTLNPEQEGSVVISGQLIGEQNEAMLTKSQLFVTPENFANGRYDATKSATITIAHVPVEISVDAPPNVIEGQRIVMNIQVRNAGTEPLVGGVLALEIPPGMQLVVEDTEFSPGFSTIDSYWELPTLAPLEQVTRAVILLAEGQSGERRVIPMQVKAKANDDLYTLRSIDQVFTLASSEVGLSQTLNGTDTPSALSAGQKVEAEITFKNTGSTALSDAIVTARFESEIVDPATIQTGGGAYDPITRTITWKAVSVPELALLQPQQQGVIKYSFSLRTVDKLPASEEAKNQNLVITAGIDSPSLAVRTGQDARAVSDRFVVPVQTNLILEPATFYDDGRLGLPSSGPVPPKVGETTTYTVRFRVGTTLNDVGDVRLHVTLPESVTYTGNIYKTEGEVTYNDRTNEVTWNVPLIPGLAGRLSPGPELHMQVAITPGENVKGQPVQLFSSAKLDATDTFADVAVATELASDELLDTEDASPQNGKVE